MTAVRKGFVALLKVPLTEALLTEILENWLARYDSVEQLRSLGGGKMAGYSIQSPADVVWERDLQFRVVSGEQFSWVYLTSQRRVIESDGLADPAGPILSLDVFSDLAFCERVVSDADDKILDKWEAQGLM